MSKHDKEDRTHPSYGIIYIGRVLGTQRLFGSDFTHHNFISLTISTAKLYDRFGVRSEIMSDEKFVEIHMSEAQFGRLVSSLNMGGGTHCTLEHVHCPKSLEKFKDKRIPMLEPEDIRQTHKDKVKEIVEERLEKLREIEQRIADWRDAKHRPTLAELAILIKDIQCLHLASNFSYFQQTLEEMMELTIEEGRTEIEAHASQILQKMGLDEVHRQSLPEAPHAPQERLGTSNDSAREGLVESGD